MSKVYLVTGCSSGLGYNLAKAIVSAGHKLIATSRTPSKVPDIVAEIQKLGGHWGELDVTSPASPSTNEPIWNPPKKCSFMEPCKTQSTSIYF
jgi:NAD(P)-dependent dehydrogenase (short-subunit alcohol dehydrogenase family)